ncbi:hypothetical protein [uncultured Campylobacter sp.]|uniref:hypothetical protein n=1 Tax=uncultured Campylobacter sp. TaxID=218934 RepID=UPI002608AFC2|nr:hypothetical protein [uncultured Campylobacter sp.]
MEILTACKLCSGALAPVRSQPKMFAGAAQTRFCRTASSCETQDLAAEQCLRLVRHLLPMMTQWLQRL